MRRSQGGWVELAIEALLCVTDRCLPAENRHCVSPAYLARMHAGQVANCEPEKTAAVEWFALSERPLNLTMTTRNAIRPYARPHSAHHAPLAGDAIILV